MEYVKDPAAIYECSFATIRGEADLGALPADIEPIAVRIIHACGMTDIPASLRYDLQVAAAARAALANGAPVIADCTAVAAGVMTRLLPAENEIVCTLNDARTRAMAEEAGTTRSAAAVTLWAPHLAGAVVVIGNAPTALFALLEALDQGAPKPAAILAFPVGFVGAAESKQALSDDPRGVPYLTLLGRRGGSAMAAAALNGAAAGLGT